MQNNKPKLLLHSCCGPCSTVCIERLEQDYDVTVFYFNPCIFPREEYEKRLEEQIRFLKDKKIPIINIAYDNESYEKLVKGFEQEAEGGKRCEICFAQRLEMTAKYASEHNYDCYSTTLTVSPHKNTLLINKIGEEQSEKYDIEFLSENFKKQNGYLRSIEIAKSYSLYRQNYCGCRYSKRT